MGDATNESFEEITHVFLTIFQYVYRSGLFKCVGLKGISFHTSRSDHQKFGVSGKHREKRDEKGERRKKQIVDRRGKDRKKNLRK